MCLDMRYDKKTEKAMIAKLPDEFVVYKIVKKRGSKYHPPCVLTFTSYEIGLNEAPTSRFQIPAHGWPKIKPVRNYLPYYHCFRTKQGAMTWGRSLLQDKKRHVVKLKIPKKWIRAIGVQKGFYTRNYYQVIVSKKIIMPDPSDKTAVVA